MTEIIQTPCGETACNLFSYHSPASVFYLAGHRNTLQEHKGQLLEDLCQKNKISLTHWAYHGWDESKSKAVPPYGEGYIRDWLRQTLEVFDALTNGPQVLVGYSMGGYLALALAVLRPEKIKGIIGLAPGFGADLCAQAEQIYGSYDFLTLSGQGLTIRKITSDNILKFNSPLPISCPLRLYHALNDPTVNWRNCIEISQNASTSDVFVTFIKAEEKPHRLWEQKDIDWLEQNLRSLIRT